MELIILLLWIACGIGAMVVAERKGHSAGGWFVIGAIFGIFGLGATLLLDDRQIDKS